MLVLTRKKEEKLYIGNDITLTILKIKGNSVQIGVEAPRQVRVLRGELIGVASDEGDGLQGGASSPNSSVTRRPSGANRLRELAAQRNEESAASTAMLQLV